MSFNKCLTTLATAFLLVTAPSLAPAAGYALARIPTPVFSSADRAVQFDSTPTRGNSLDQCGQLRGLEFVALPGTVFTVQATESIRGVGFLRVTTAEYPGKKVSYFIDSRFVEISESRPPERVRHLPERNEILAALRAAEGSMYVWGGNVRRGIPELLMFNPPQNGHKVTQETMERWQLRGVDCSGLLYEATGGWTPRNTADLITFGAPVPAAGLSVEEISRRVEPLDLIIWQGHVMIVLDKKQVIQSRLSCGKKSGVIVTPLKETLGNLMRRRLPVDDYDDDGSVGSKRFVVRRWYGNGFQ